MRVGDISTQELIDRIYDSWTLEDAIFWRREFSRRLTSLIANRNLFDARERDEVNLYAAAKSQAELAIARLEICLAERADLVWERGRAPRFHRTI